MSKRDDSIKLKHFLDAIKGRRLSGTMAHQINETLDTHYEGDDKLSAKDCIWLAVVVEQMTARGVKPAKSLLTPHQRKSLARRQA